jgi:hypothetical protein
MKIEVKNCSECPFVNNDNEYGKDQCNLNKDIITIGFVELPSDKVHEDCPLLKEKEIIVFVNK